MPMVEIAALSRVLCGDHWREPEEWAAAIHRLADLDDGQLATLIGLCRDGAQPPRQR
jgi:hypothetical protein